MKRNLVIGGAVVAILIAAAFALKSTREQSGTADFPDGMHWLCPSCQYGFSTSREAFADWVDEHPDERLECPQCRRRITEVARHCPLPDCGKYYTQANLVLDGKVCCPICRQPLP